MNNTESGTPPEKDGTSQNPAGSRMTLTEAWRYLQLKSMQNEISKLGQSIPNNTKSESTGHDAGDEDPKAWSEKA